MHYKEKGISSGKIFINYSFTSLLPSFPHILPLLSSFLFFFLLSSPFSLFSSLLPLSLLFSFSLFYSVCGSLFNAVFSSLFLSFTLSVALCSMLCFVLFYSNHNVSFISFSSFHSILINLHSLLHFLLFFSFLFSSIFYSSFLFFSLLFSTPLPSNVLQAMKVLVEQAVLFNLIGTENILCIYSVLIKFFFIAFSKLNCCFSELFFFVKFFLDFL